MKVLVVAVHPDDETLGCGATLLRERDAGCELHWLILTAAKGPEYSAEQIETQAEQIRLVSQAYGFASTSWLGFPTTSLDTIPRGHLIRPILTALQAVKPSVIFLPHRGDVHSDHRVAWEVLQSCIKPANMPEGDLKVMACETLSETDAAPALPETMFMPNVFVDVSRTLERKIEVFKLYRTEIQGPLMPRSSSSIRALARLRGSVIGVEYAEAFMLIREIVRDRASLSGDARTTRID